MLHGVVRRHALLAAVFALALLIGVPALAASRPKLGNVMGYVRDQDTGAALAGARVAIGDTATLTAADGRYRLVGVPMGKHTVTASLAGYSSATVAVRVKQKKTVTAPVLHLARVAFPPPPPPPGDGGTDPHPGDGGTPPNPTPPAPGSTIPWDGISTFWFGVNYPWWNYATDFGTGGWGKYTDWNAIGGHFAGMRAAGSRVARWWVFGDGRYAPDWNADGTVSGLDESFLADIDRALELAARENVYLILTLVDFPMLNAPSFSGGVQMGGHSAIVTDAAAQQSYLDRALKPLLQRVAASPNKRFVLAYDVINEPEGAMRAFWGGAGIETAQMQAFARRCVEYIHAYGGGAYATLGSAAPEYVHTWKGLGLDIYQVHYYPWMDYGNGAGSGLPSYTSLGLDRPCIVGEFPSNAVSYGMNDTIVHSARWYLDAIYAKGYAGALAWSYAHSDSAGNWSGFRPVFTDWAQDHANLIGPH